MTREKLRFSTETAQRQSMKIGFMRTHVISVPVAIFLGLASVSAPVGAADLPLDFSYRVSGAGEVKPLLVFNDGIDTFIQPQDPTDKGVSVNGATPVRQGPYFVIRGVVNEITLSQSGKSTVRIAYTKAPVIKAVDVPVAVADIQKGARPTADFKEPQTVVPSKIEPSIAPGETSALALNGAVKAASCEPYRQTRESAFVASFKAGTSALSDLAKAEVKKFIGDISSISSVHVMAEGVEKVSGQKRADTIKDVLVAAGIDRSKIQTTIRMPTGIGSEIHIHRSIEIPCGSAVVRIPSNKGSVTVIWDRGAKELAERIAGELKVKLVVTGEEREMPVRVSAVEMPFNEAMQLIGDALDEAGDLILRSNELILNFKEKQ